MDNKILFEIDNLYKIIELTLFRKTKGVTFDIISRKVLPKISSIDRVLHDSDAVSPGTVGSVKRPWYMHPDQDDNLLVLAGIRHVQIYTPRHGKIVTFDVTPNTIHKDGKLLYEGSAMLIWPKGVFHRIISGKNGSASINFAVHYDGFDINTNFNIYSVNTENGTYSLLREGYKDQYDGG